MILFQIPVYAESSDEYNRWRESRVAPHVEASVASGRGEDHGRAVGLSIHGTSWLYNRVVGWLEIDASPDVVKLYYVGTNQARIRRDRRDRFQFGDRVKLTEVWLSETSSAPDTWSAVESELTRASREEPLRGRWIDREAFDTLGPYVDFPRLLRWSR